MTPLERFLGDLATFAANLRVALEPRVSELARVLIALSNIRRAEREHFCRPSLRLPEPYEPDPYEPEPERARRRIGFRSSGDADFE